MTEDDVYYSGWEVVDRRVLLAALRRRWVAQVHDEVVLDHVTLDYPATDFPMEVGEVVVVGHAYDEISQSLLVRVGGYLEGAVRRPDGHLFHITCSVVPGVEHVAGRDVFRDARLFVLDDPIRVPVRAFLRKAGS